MTSRVVVEADGGARGNPGPAGYGALVRDAATGEVLAERAEAIGVATNNVAEYQGLIAGLAAAAELNADEVEVRMDSKLVIEQMTGRWKIKHPGLRPLAAQAATLVRSFSAVSWQWVPRERNRDADRLANQAMDAAARGEAAARGTDTAGTRSAAGSEPRRAEAPARGSWDPPETTPTRLILIRHGATARTTERRYSGRGDVPLSADGQTQAEAVARRVAALAPKLTAVVSSPLIRCTATAEAVARAVGDPPVVIEPDLVECDLGQWEGRTFTEVREGWPDDLAAWQAGRGAAPGGESLRQVAKRVRRATAALRETYPGGTVVVVSHVWPLKLMLRDALVAADAFLSRLLLAPAGLSVVDSYPDGTVAVHTVNDTSHLAA
jgi:broad specificity phosphatase PhoE/ribonuclease HI